MRRVKSELERRKFLTLGGHIACLGTRTSGYVRVLEEYGSVSCGFSTAIRPISHSVGISHTQLPKRTRSIYEKLNVTIGTPV